MNVQQLRHQFLIALGYTSLSVGLLAGCETEEKPATDTDTDTDTDTEEPDPLDIDDDGDGQTENEGDCNDEDPTIYTGSEEILNDSIDQDCDGSDLVDADLDGFPSTIDCNDENPDIHPEAEEICDSIDNNCDGSVDENAVDALVFYADTDNDGFGDENNTIAACSLPDGYVENTDDCDDSSAANYPGAEEVSDDGVDNNCDGTIDEIECPTASIPADAATIESNYWNSNLIPYMFCEPIPSTNVCDPASQIDPYRMVVDTVGTPNDTWCDWIPVNPVCGPDSTMPNECCYVFGVDLACIAVGRPLFVDGDIRTAPAIESSHWCRDTTLPYGTLSDSQRTRIVQEWVRAAQEEHASIASFARFTIELMALGAPPDLIAGATRAQADELAHARACFSIASAISGQDIGPGKLNIDGIMDKTGSPEQILVQTIIEGCVNETLAAAEAGWLVHKTPHRSIQQTLQQIATDESRHATLAWKTVQWILQQHPEFRSIARLTFAQTKQQIERMDKTETQDQWMEAYGRMPAQEGNKLRRKVWKEVIEPCVKALYDGPVQELTPHHRTA